MEDAEDEYERHSVLHSLKNAILAPFRIATSPTLLRTYLKTFLFLIASSILFAVALVAYTSFYYAYIPIRGLSAPVYLQYDHVAQTQIPTLEGVGVWVECRKIKHPYGIANVQGLVSRQKYDVVVDMHVPRSERNLAAGNWMLSLEMRGPEMGGGDMKGMLGWDEEWEMDGYSQETVSEPATDKFEQKAPDDLGSKSKAEKPIVLARSRRPAILTYRSRVTELAHRVLRLPLYVLGFGHEGEHVTTKMMEGVIFEKGWRNVPSSLRLEVRSNLPLEVYGITVRVVARLEGIRWIMYTYRLSSAAFFISIFWGVEMGVVLLTWGIFSLFFSRLDERDAPDSPSKISTPSEKRRIKQEDDSFTTVLTPKTDAAEESLPATPLSDTSRTFPTLSRHQPLHYSSSETKHEEGAIENDEDVKIKEEEEADDEEDDDFLLEEPLTRSAADLDSGIGTGLESSAERDKGLGRRRSGRWGR
ncbi:hypothetical protein DM02DRAFT_610066 [Periconia macrospinosa]|uniref:Adipose-regulatory protein-domain-containing protein n=1 Tax=Periconia macrospinosa TaxID=97972 RepID=A0A2V1E6A5_9PLEO|nr:hypothetical protein DM02DRAFT_610066 [Periconia macrospinosa]